MILDATDKNHVPYPAMAKKKSAARKNPAAVALGRKGGSARAQKLTEAERSEAARKASQARWAQERAKRKGKPNGEKKS
jgi:hypothetical protein